MIRQNKDNLYLTTLISLLIVFIIPFSSGLVSGDFKIGVIVFDFNDSVTSCSNSQVNGIMFTNSNSVANYYKESSFNNVNIYGDILPRVYLSNYSSKVCLDTFWENEARAILERQGYNITQYSKLVFVADSTACGYAGAAGGSNALIVYCTHNEVYDHEYGHLLQMSHATTDLNNDGIVDDEYGDKSDAMSSGNTNTQNSPHKYQNEWIPRSKYITLTSSGTYDIAPVETNPAQTNLPQGIKIFNPSLNRYYYISYRKAIGLNSGLSTTYKDKTNIHAFGIYDRGNTYFITSLANGQVFTDNSLGLSVKQINYYSDRATIEVNFGASGVCSRGNPTLTINPSSQTSTSIGTLQYTISLTNNDNSYCGSTGFILTPSSSSGWTGSLSPTSLTLSPGTSGTSTFLLTPSSNTLSGTYPFTISSSGSDPSHIVSSQGSYVLNLPSDNQDPTAPTNLVATKTVQGKKVKIALTWGASSDNVGVSQYLVYRNGALLSTLSGTTLSYSDSSVKVGNTYNYYVVAKDASGNISPASNSVSITT